MLAAMAKSMTAGVVLLIVDIALKAIQVHLAVAPGAALQCGIECMVLSGADGAAVVFFIVITIAADNGGQAHDHTCPSSLIDSWLSMVSMMSAEFWCADSVSWV